MALGFLGGDNTFVSILIFVLFLMFYPRLVVWQVTTQMEASLRKLDVYREKTEDYLLKRIQKRVYKNVKKKLRDYEEFFAIPPVDLDPFGIIDKLDHIIRNSERKISGFIDDLAGRKLDPEEKADLMMAFKGVLGATIARKILRHYIEVVKKTNNLQVAMIIQMQLPFLMREARANVRATRAIANNIPIGDTIGPMVAASFMKNKPVEIARDIVVSKEKIEGKTVFVMKSKGPGSRLGDYGNAVRKLVEKEGITHIITVDASAKLEGEETGTIAEGVGVAMGGSGVERSRIEEVAKEKKIDLDAIAIKQSVIESAIAMKKKIFDALGPARERVLSIIRNSPHKKILLIGVGNTVGVGNRQGFEPEVKKKLAPYWKEYTRIEKKKKEIEKTLWYKLFGYPEDFEEVEVVSIAPLFSGLTGKRGGAGFLSRLFTV